VRRGSLKLADVPKYRELLEAVKKAYRDVSSGRYRLRDLALVAVLTFTGCRIGEALLLSREDLDPRERTVRVRQLKKRGEAFRLVPVPSPLFWDIVDSYLWRAEGRLFAITKRQARNVVYKFTKRYLGKRVRPHAIRHAYALAVLELTKNVEVVRRLLGHTSYDSLKSYLDYTQRDLEEELAKLFSVG